MGQKKRGSKYWVRFGFNHQRYSKASPDNTLAGARAYEAMLRQKLARGESIDERPKEKMATYSEFVERWFDTYVKTNNKPSEQSHKADVIKNHLKPFFGKTPLDRINNLMIEEYKAKKQKQGICNKTINNHIGMLGKSLRCAEDWEIITKVPKIQPLKVPPQTFKFLTEEEYNLLLESAKKSEPEIYEMILFALRTGVRVGELLVIDWSDISFSNGSVTIKRSVFKGIIGSPKSNRFRRIPLAKDVLDLLYQRRQKEGFVFLNNEGQIYSRYSLDRALDRACKAAGVPIVSWHPLRHSFASKLANNGISIQVIQTLLGHSDIKVTQRYAHLEPATLVEAIQTLEPKRGVEINLGYNAGTIAKSVEGVGERTHPKRASFSLK